MPADQLATVIHRFGMSRCGGVAFHYDVSGEPREDMIESERVRFQDGSRPAPGEEMRCGQCGLLIVPEDLDWLPGEFQEVAA